PILSCDGRQIIMRQVFHPLLTPLLNPPMSLRFCIWIGLCLGMPFCSVFAADQTNAAVAHLPGAYLTQTFRSMDSLDNKQKLGPGDRIAYRVIEDQDEPRELLVTDSGDLEVPYLGLIHAAGKTCLE